ncbi:MAG TPA: hypothetical protein VH349_08770 [Ktedonobacterales bacterium]|jgi:hypothetical protein
MSVETPNSQGAVHSVWRTRLARLLIYVLDSLWHSLSFIFGGVIVGGILVNTMISLLSTGTIEFDSPSRWGIVQLITANPVLGLIIFGGFLVLSTLGFLAHRLAHTGYPSTTVKPQEGDEQDPALILRKQRLSRIVGWMASDTQMWNAVQEVLIKHRTRELEQWLSEDPAIALELARVTVRMKPRSVQNAVFTSLTVLTSIFSIVGVILSAFALFGR